MKASDRADPALRCELSAAEIRRLKAHTTSWSGWRPSASGLAVGRNTDGCEPPLFWSLQEHRELRSLANHLGETRPLYGLRSGFGILDPTPERIRALAHRFVEEIVAIRPEGPYLLGGNCHGGRVAMDVARELLGRGATVALLCLLDIRRLQPHPGPVALFYGSESRFNPFRSPDDGAFRPSEEIFPAGFSVDLLPGADHGQYFDEPHVTELSTRLRTRLDAAVTGRFTSPAPTSP